MSLLQSQRKWSTRFCVEGSKPEIKKPNHPLLVRELDERVAPAALIHSLFLPAATGPEQDTNYGFSVAASGSYYLVGAPLLDVSGLINVGRAFVYDTAGNLLHTLDNPTPAADDVFGASVAVSESTVVVGTFADNTGGDDAGSVYVFDLSSATPTVPAYTLNNPAPAESDRFGSSVAVSGTIVVVGAWRDDTLAMNAGSAYVYDLASLTPTVPAYTLNCPCIPTLGAGFGQSVAVSGKTVVVGADRDDTGAADAGSAYVYDLMSMTPPVPTYSLHNPTPAVFELFGYSLAVSGTTVVVGAYRDGTVSSNAGSAYVFDLTSSTPSTPIYTLNNPPPLAGDWFGWSVAVSGHLVVVGAHHDDAGASDSGVAYVYDLASTTPTAPITLSNPTPGATDWFGYSVAVSGTKVIVSAVQDDTKAKDQGATYVFVESQAAPQVAKIDVNDGTVQRSRVTSLRVTFDQVVNLPANPADAFQLKRQSDNAVVTLSASVEANSVTLNFAGGPTNFGSLADGRYTLTIVASQVSSANGILDGNGDGTPGDNFILVGDPAVAPKLYRLFGDVDGDGDVDTTDYVAFRAVYGGSSFAFDFDGDGDVDASDFGQFRGRFGQVV